MAIPIPSMVLKQLHTFGSLKNTADGVEFSVKNRLNDTTLTGLTGLKFDCRFFVVPHRQALRIRYGFSCFDALDKVAGFIDAITSQRHHERLLLVHEHRAHLIKVVDVGFSDSVNHVLHAQAGRLCLAAI